MLNNQTTNFTTYIIKNSFKIAYNTGRVRREDDFDYIDKSDVDVGHDELFFKCVYLYQAGWRSHIVASLSVRIFSRGCCFKGRK